MKSKVKWYAGIFVMLALITYFNDETLAAFISGMAASLFGDLHDDRERT
jgi:hypothetical protein